METNMSFDTCARKIILENSPYSSKLRTDPQNFVTGVGTLDVYITEKFTQGNLMASKEDIVEIRNQLDILIEEHMGRKRTKSQQADSVRPAEDVAGNKKVWTITSGWFQAGVRVEPTPTKLRRRDELQQSRRNCQVDIPKMDMGHSIRMYDPMLNFTNDFLKSDEMRLDYLSFKRSDSNALLKLVATVVWICFGASLIQVHNVEKTNAAYVAALVAAAVALLLSVVTLSFTTATIFRRHDITWGWSAFQEFAEDIAYKPLGRLTEDALVFSSQLAASLLLLADSMESRPLHQHADLPPDLTVASMTIVLLSQIFCKSASKTAVVMSWATSIILANVSMFLVGSDLYFWTDAVYLFLFIISYELERQSLRHFIKSILAVEITEHNADLQIQLANQQIREGEQSLEANRSVVRHVGHEIRGPLNTIGIGMDILVEELAAFRVVPKTITDIVNNMRHASSCALETVNELLCFEKLAAGMQTIEPSKQAIVPYIRESMKPHILPAMAKSIKFELVLGDRCDDDAWVSLDPVKCKIVFRNLFSNAIKFSKINGLVEVRMEIREEAAVPINQTQSADSENREAGASGSAKTVDVMVISCRDEGAGLSKENLELLFQEGKQFNANTLQNGGGSGFGLFITKGIIEQHKDTKIWAISEGEDKGCTFFVQMPLVKRAPGRRPQTESIIAHSPSESLQMARVAAIAPFLLQGVAEERGRGEGSDECSPLPNPTAQLTAIPEQRLVRVDSMSFFNEPSNSSRLVPAYNPNALNILIVDDSPANRKMVGRLLKMDGHHCVEAMDGLAAVGAVSRTLIRRLNGDQPPPFDVVLIDKNMPIMSGPEATQEMRKLGFINPIIGITGSEEHEDFLLAGANTVMVKPINKLSLMSAITAALASYPTPRAVSIPPFLPMDFAAMEI